MKKNFLLSIIGFLSSLVAISQTSGYYVSATLTPGSASNSVYVTFKTNTTLTNSKFSTFQFAIGLPSTITPFSNATITSSDPAISYFPYEVSTEIGGIKSFTVYSFSGDGSQSGPGITYNTGVGVEYTIAEVFFTGGGANAISNLRIIQIPVGGLANGNDNFYVADRGFDVTNQPSQFYSSTPGNVSNDGNGYTGYSYAIISSGVLPIKLTDFSVVKKNNDAILSWQVSNQDVNSSHFELERSFNGSDFKNIGRVDVNLNSGSYTFNDKDGATSKTYGIIYYRLKMVDKDAKYTYSSIKNIRLTNKSFGINVYPNPAKSFSNVSIELENASPIILSLNDASGKLVQKIEFNGYKGLNQKKIELSNLASGSYLLKVNTGNEIQTIPIIKE